MKPGEHLTYAEDILLGIESKDCTAGELIALAQARIDLASAQMLGRLKAP